MRDALGECPNEKEGRFCEGIEVQFAHHETINLGDTVHLVAAEVRDAEGHAVPGATITSALGIDYLHLGGPLPIPELATILILSAGVIGIAAVRRVRSKRGAAVQLRH